MHVGKSAKPEAFINFSLRFWMLYNTNQRNAWIDSNLFKKWFFDQWIPPKHLTVKKKNRKKAIYYKVISHIIISD